MILSYFSKIKNKKVIWGGTLKKKYIYIYIECSKKVETSKYLGKYKFYRKVFQTKVVGLKKILPIKDIY